MIGPFIAGVDYLGKVNGYLSPENRKYEILIEESDLHKYKFLSFKFKQDLHRFHQDSIFVFLQTDGSSEMLFAKPTPTQVYEFLEYRVRLSSSIFEGKTWAKLIFYYKGLGSSGFDIDGLYFGPVEDEDNVILPTGITITTVGGGITSPIPGYNPVRVGETVNIDIYPYNGVDFKKVVFYGNAYDENGVKYPKTIYDKHFKIKYINAFENIQIAVYFGEINVGEGN